MSLLRKLQPKTFYNKNCENKQNSNRILILQGYLETHRNATHFFFAGIDFSHKIIQKDEITALQS